MRKLKITLLICFCAYNAFTQLLNNDFEDWRQYMEPSSSVYHNVPHKWIPRNFQDSTFLTTGYSFVYEENNYYVSGGSAIRIINYAPGNNSCSPGYIDYGSMSISVDTIWGDSIFAGQTTGNTFIKRPSYFGFYYKMEYLNPNPNFSGYGILTLTKWNGVGRDTIGESIISINNNGMLDTSSFIFTSNPVNYFSNDIPDSVFVHITNPCDPFYDVITIIDDIIIEYDTVWPGDANGDGIANNFDIFNIGIGYSSAGPLRSSSTNNWQGQNANSWSEQFINSLNYAHADCNGDGIIDDNDTLAIWLNYNLTHNKNSGSENVDPVLFYQIPADTVPAGTTVNIPIHLGTFSLPVDSIYGIAFTITIDTSLVDTSSLHVSFVPSWLGTQGSDLLTFQKKFTSEGEIHIGMVRTNQQMTSGFGEIAQLEIVSSDDLSGKTEIFQTLALDFINVKAILIDGSEVAIGLMGATIVLDDSDVLSNSLKNNNISKASVFPNPARQILNIVSEDHNTSIKLMNQAGQILFSGFKSQDLFPLSTSNVPAGYYYLKLSNQKSNEVLKIQIIK